MSQLISFVFYSLLYNSIIQDLTWEESKGKEDQQEEAALGEDPEKEEEKKTLSVRVTIIRKLIYHCYDHKSHAVFFLISPPLSSLLKPFYSASLLCSVSKSSRVAYGRSNKSG